MRVFLGRLFLMSAVMAILATGRPARAELIQDYLYTGASTDGYDPNRPSSNNGRGQASTSGSAGDGYGRAGIYSAGPDTSVAYADAGSAANGYNESSFAESYGTGIVGFTLTSDTTFSLSLSASQQGSGGDYHNYSYAELYGFPTVGGEVLYSVEQYDRSNSNDVGYVDGYIPFSGSVTGVLLPGQYYVASVGYNKVPGYLEGGGYQNGYGYAEVVLHTSSVPEPSSFALLGLGGIGLALGAYQRRRSV